MKKEIEEKQLLERTVELVKKARSLGVWVIHVTEGYSNDYRELDPTNPGGFHRGQILRQAWKTGTEIQSYYPPLVPGPGDKDLVLPPRIQTSAFGGTGLDQILRSRGIKNIAVAGFTTDVCVYATVTTGYDLGYHVYALKDAMVGYFPRAMRTDAEKHLSDVVQGVEQRRMAQHAERRREAVGALVSTY